MFEERLPADKATWTRGRSWRIWKAVIVLVQAQGTGTDRDEAELTKSVIDKILADHSDAR